MGHFTAISTPKTAQIGNFYTFCLFGLFDPTEGQGGLIKAGLTVLGPVIGTIWKTGYLTRSAGGSEKGEI